MHSDKQKVDKHLFLTADITTDVNEHQQMSNRHQLTSADVNGHQQQMSQQISIADPDTIIVDPTPATSSSPSRSTIGQTVQDKLGK